MLVDLLAAVPSVVYGLWGVFVLIPKLKPIEKWFAEHVLVHPVHRRRQSDARAELLHRRADPGDHDPADRLGDRARGDRDRPVREQGGGAGARRDALGDDPDGGAPVRPSGHHRRRDARARPRDRRDDRGRARDRQRAGDRPHIFQPGLLARGGDRERVRRGGQHADPQLGAVRRRPGAVRADADRQHHRPLVHQPRRAQAPRPTGRAGVSAAVQPAGEVA